MPNSVYKIIELVGGSEFPGKRSQKMQLKRRLKVSMICGLQRSASLT